MAYNGGFPVGYQAYYPQPQYQPQPQQSNGIIWVQGEAGAKSYLVAPNTTVQLWDSENQVIYLKSADASGMPSMKVLDYKIRDAQQAQAQAVIPTAQVDYVTREELMEFKNQIKEQLLQLKRSKYEQSTLSDDEPAGK